MAGQQTYLSSKLFSYFHKISCKKSYNGVRNKTPGSWDLVFKTINLEYFLGEFKHHRWGVVTSVYYGQNGHCEQLGLVLRIIAPGEMNVWIVCGYYNDILITNHRHSTGCCKTSVKLWKNITETLYGVFIVFLGSVDCQIWAIFHFSTLWLWKLTYFLKI